MRKPYLPQFNPAVTYVSVILAKAYGFVTDSGRDFGQLGVTSGGILPPILFRNKSTYPAKKSSRMS